MKILKIFLKTIGGLLVVIILLAAYIFLTYKYQFNNIPEKELVNYTGSNVDYPFENGKFSIPTPGPSNFWIIPKDSILPGGQRNTVSLNGEWQIEEGDWDHIPEVFNGKCPVPGFVDQSVPAFKKVGESSYQISLSFLKPSNLMALPRLKDPNREAYWYKRTFVIENPEKVTFLKVHRAAYASTVWINGTKVGENGRLYSPGLYNISSYVQTGENEVIIRVASDIRYGRMNNVPGDVLEKVRHIAGIYDDVELIITDKVRIEKVQIVPDLAKESVRVLAWVKNYGDHDVASKINFDVLDYNDMNKSYGTVSTIEDVVLNSEEQKIVDVVIPIDSCKLWSPESPNLYNLKVTTSGDANTTRFGMRSFHFDETTKIPMLNGKPYYMRGTNVPFFRFAENPDRGDKAWDEKWVRTVIHQFKSMNWNQLRFHVGPAPSLWYKVADEEGFLVQDEYAVWTVMIFRLGLPLDTLVSEYVHWMEEQWNYPSLVIWDAQNESTQDVEPRTGYALNMVRSLDLSNRPWDNGWGDAQQPLDTEEKHPYLFVNSMMDVFGIKPGPLFKMDSLNTVKPDFQNIGEKGNPVLLNEYAWLWVRKDGEPTKITKGGYDKYFTDWTKEQRFEFYGRTSAALTEFYRSQRPAGVMLFAGLNSNFPGCATTDIFTDYESLKIEPFIKKYLPDAFSPLGICIYNWSDTIQAGSQINVPITLINDLEMDWHGNLELSIVSDKGNVWETTSTAEVASYGKGIFEYKIEYPSEKGWYELIATIRNSENNPIRSYRKFYIKE